jgi:hypothetical protein
MIKSFFRSASFTVFVVLLLIAAGVGYYFLNNKHKDGVSIKQTRETVTWIENFYTTNGRFPNPDELNKQFPNYESRREYIASGLDNKESNPAQSFILSYYLSKKSTDAPGEPGVGGIGEYPGYYNVYPCGRWDKFGFNSAQVSTYVYPPGGLVYTDFNSGEIYFTQSGKHDSKAPLLTGLSKPRILNPSTQQTTSKDVVITHGNDIIRYDWDGSRLRNPTIIGQVPTSCP